MNIRIHDYNFDSHSYTLPWLRLSMVRILLPQNRGLTEHPCLSHWCTHFSQIVCVARMTRAESGFSKLPGQANPTPMGFAIRLHLTLRSVQRWASRGQHASYPNPGPSIQLSICRSVRPSELTYLYRSYCRHRAIANYLISLTGYFQSIRFLIRAK